MALTAFGGVSEGITEGLKNTEQLQNIEYNKQKAAIGEIQLKEAQRQQEMDNTVIPLSSLQKGFELFPSYSGGLLQMGKDMGIVKDIGGQQGVLAGDFKRLNKMLGDVEAYKDKSLEWVSSDLANLRKNIEGKIAEVKSDKDKEPLQNQLKVVMQQQEKNTNEMYKRQVGMKKIADENTPESFAKFYNGGTVADLVPIEMEKEHIRATKEKGLQLQDKGILKDGRTVSFDPSTGKKIVEGGELYNKSTHGIIKTNALSQNTVYNVTNQQKDEFSGWSEDIKEQEYKDSLATGVIPTFGGGVSGAKSRQQFKKGFAAYKIQNGITSGEAVDVKTSVEALSGAKKQHEKRKNIISVAITQIEQNSALVKKLRAKYGSNYGRLFNSALNAAITGTTGSGDIEALRLVLNSASGEIGKVERNSLGVSELSVSQSNIMNKIHDLNLNAEDLDKVLDVGIELGKRTKIALDRESKNLSNQIKSTANRTSNDKQQKQRVKMSEKGIAEERKRVNEAIKEAASKTKTDEELKSIRKQITDNFTSRTGVSY